MLIPIHERSYARSELLAETGWLADRIGDAQIRVVDARSVRKYATGHIAGSVHLDGFGNLPRDEKGDMGSPEEFAGLAGELGIENDSTVVVYDTPSQRMGMVAWAFMYYGHADVRILDGGVTKWLAEGRTLATQTTERPPSTYIAKTVESIYCSLQQAKAAEAGEDFVFWDTRSADEYQGKVASVHSRCTAPGMCPSRGTWPNPRCWTMKLRR